MDQGQIVVDSILPIGVADITEDLARESGFSSVKELLETAQHGRGDNVYLIRFHYLPAGGWDVPPGRRTLDEDRDEGGTESARASSSAPRSTLLQRIRNSTPPGRKKGR